MESSLRIETVQSRFTSIRVNCQLALLQRCAIDPASEQGSVSFLLPWLEITEGKSVPRAGVTGRAKSITATLPFWIAGTEYDEYNDLIPIRMSRGLGLQ
jgi:hypothetical protein